jgi:hypothetical protein
MAETMRDQAAERIARQAEAIHQATAEMTAWVEKHDQMTDKVLTLAKEIEWALARGDTKAAKQAAEAQRALVEAIYQEREAAIGNR